MPRQKPARRDEDPTIEVILVFNGFASSHYETHESDAHWWRLRVAPLDPDVVLQPLSFCYVILMQRTTTSSTGRPRRTLEKYEALLPRYIFKMTPRVHWEVPYGVNTSGWKKDDEDKQEQKIDAISGFAMDGLAI
ncbi:hypothetical protein NLI96_g8592 [Meripilus lineatus]|uniref:Uncharacterized protein n=1 Tax=Meripilus lineatus TaxID=2056292 RepID=A0AAD5YBV4_9APHY|nr:hypothetical protein NLI96_g8592 [Physisporinus lineatus]